MFLTCGLQLLTHGTKYGVQVGDSLHNADMSIARSVPRPHDWDPADADGAVLLSKDCIDAGHSVLIFCGTKRVCAITHLILI